MAMNDSCVSQRPCGYGVYLMNLLKSGLFFILFYFFIFNSLRFLFGWPDSSWFEI